MNMHSFTVRGTLVLVLMLSMAACSKKEDKMAPAAIPTGNAAKVLSAADCDKLPDPAPRDGSAAARATAISEGVAARMACKKAASESHDPQDLARIRAIQEQQEADRQASKKSEADFRQGLKEGAAKPIQELKY